MSKSLIHHCFNCGEETEDYEELPNGRKLYVCSARECVREFNDACREIQDEARHKAEDDEYSAYY